MSDFSIVYTSPSIAGRYEGGTPVFLSAHSNGTVIVCMNAAGLGVMHHLGVDGARALARQLDIAADAIDAAQQQVAA